MYRTYAELLVLGGERPAMRSPWLLAAALALLLASAHAADKGASITLKAKWDGTSYLMEAAEFLVGVHLPESMHAPPGASGRWHQRPGARNVSDDAERPSGMIRRQTSRPGAPAAPPSPVIWLKPSPWPSVPHGRPVGAARRLRLAVASRHPTSHLVLLPCRPTKMPPSTGATLRVGTTLPRLRRTWGSAGRTS